MRLTETINKQVQGIIDPNNIIIVVSSYSEQEPPQGHDPTHYSGTLDYLTSLKTLIPDAIETINDDNILNTDEGFFDLIPEAIETLIQFAWVYKCLGNEEESKKLVDIVENRLPRLIDYGLENCPEENEYTEFNLAELPLAYNRVIRETYKILRPHKH